MRLLRDGEGAGVTGGLKGNDRGSRREAAEGNPGDLGEISGGRCRTVGKTVLTCGSGVAVAERATACEQRGRSAGH